MLQDYIPGRGSLTGISGKHIAAPSREAVSGVVPLSECDLSLKKVGTSDEYHQWGILHLTTLHHVVSSDHRSGLNIPDCRLPIPEIVGMLDCHLSLCQSIGCSHRKCHRRLWRRDQW